MKTTIRSKQAYQASTVKKKAHRSNPAPDAPRVDVYSRITDIIAAETEKGVIPWRKTWGMLADGTPDVPRNYITNRPYTGINSLLLACTPYDRPYFLTFNQAKAKGGSIRKGAIVVFWQISQMDKEEKDMLGNASHKRVNVPLLRYYHVYNVADVEGVTLELPERRTAEVVAETELTAACDAVVAGYLNGPQLVFTNPNSAFYSPARDLVNVPNRCTFESPQAYYHVLFHELIHSTGNANRLNRKELVETEGYGGDNYSKEELTAELGACFLSAHCGLPLEQDVSLLQNAVAYLQHWLTALRSDKTLFVRAAGQAQKATNYILGAVTEDVTEAES